MFENDCEKKYKGYLNELGTWAVGMLFLLAIFLSAYLIPGPARGNPTVNAPDCTPETDTSVMSRLVRAQKWYLAKVSSKDARHGRVDEVAGFAASEAKHYSLDPHLVLMTLIDESSLKLNQIGKSDGEKGLGQQHGQALIDSVAAVRLRGIDPYSIHGQIARTAWVLSDCNSVCKDELGMVTRYLSGKCHSKSLRTQKLAKRRIARALKLATISQ